MCRREREKNLLGFCGYCFGRLSHKATCETLADQEVFRKTKYNGFEYVLTSVYINVCSVEMTLMRFAEIAHIVLQRCSVSTYVSIRILKSFVELVPLLYL
jgi:hypothetical protein